MIPFARRVHEGTHRRVVAVTAAQAGKTDNLLDVMGARLDQRPAPILYVGPSKDFVTDQFEPRFMSLLNEAKTLANKVIRGRRMKKALKFVAGVRVRLGSAGSSTTLKSDPFALGVVDEYDEMVANIKGQGDPLGLTEARGETYADFVTAVVSTCSQGFTETEIDEVNGLEFWKVGDPAQIQSPIWRLFQQGTRHHFAWPCPHCEEYFVPMFKHLRWPEGASPSKAKKEAFVQCPSCGGVIEDHHKPQMIAEGVQIAPGQTVEDAKAEINEPENSTWSCWTSGLCSPFVKFGDRAERYLNAFLSGEEDKIQTVMNAGFGELYTAGAGGELPQWREVLNHKQGYARRAPEAPIGVLRVVAGIDVQKRSLIYVIRGFGARGTSWLLDHGYLYGNTSEPKVWNDLSLLMTQPIGGLIIERAFIDSGFRPEKKDAGDEHKVYEWAHRYDYMVFPTKGRDTLGGRPYSVSKIEVRPDGSKLPWSINLVHINTDFFKSLVQSRLRLPQDHPGAFFVHNDADEDYARQIVSEVRVLGDKLKPEWVKRQKDNHFLDCEALAAAAAYSLNVQSIPEGVERNHTKPAEQAPPKDTGPDAPPRKAPSQSIRDRFRNMAAASRR